MQVLIALGGTPGRVVSRDELIETCWDARFVGEDAINRVIGKLRRVAEQAAAGAFRIDTVARVGYRLSIAPAAPAMPASAAIPPASPSRSWMRWALPALAAAILVWVAVEQIAYRPPRPLARQRNGEQLPAAVRDLETRGLAAMFENTPQQTAEAITYLRQAAERAPRTASVWGSLAMSYALDLGWVVPAERAAVAARARDAARHALALDPRDSRSLAALVSLEPTFGNWRGKDAALRAARQRAWPEAGPLLYQEIQFLVAVGRLKDASTRAERLVRASPLVPWIQAASVDLLAANGRLADADRAAQAARAIWPRERLTWFTSFDLAAFNGQPERALAMAADRGGWPKDTRSEDILLAERTVRAMMSHDPAETDRVLRDYRADAGRGHADAERAMRAAAALGRPGDALAFAEILYRKPLAATPRRTMLPRVGFDSDGERPTAALFLPPARALWTAPGFLALTARIGLLDYWRRTGAPDFCGAPEMRIACRRMGLKPGP